MKGGRPIDAGRDLAGHMTVSTALHFFMEVRERLGTEGEKNARNSSSISIPNLYHL